MRGAIETDDEQLSRRGTPIAGFFSGAVPSFRRIAVGSAPVISG